MPRVRGKRFWKRGEPLVWASGAALALMLLLTGAALTVVLVNGLAVFWPARIAELTLSDGQKVAGEWIRTQVNPDTQAESVQLKTGNRELDPQRQDFRWFDRATVVDVRYPPDLWAVERLENGNFYGVLQEIAVPGLELAAGPVDAGRLHKALQASRDKAQAELAPIAAELAALGSQLESVRDARIRLEYRKKRLAAGADAAREADLDRRIAALESQSDAVKGQSDVLVARQHELEKKLRVDALVFGAAGGRSHRIALLDVVRPYQPNAMGLREKLVHYLAKVWEVLWANPRECNTEGGLFPAIFGTVMLVFIMAVSCFPLGVMAGIYLGEYAREGLFVRLVRIAVNNLAGIPSIVYGIFGLGFFVYGVGGVIDHWLFPERAAANMPVFGTGGILWASLTLGLLTVPVVIVSTEEALRAIPRGIREGSLALGATRFQTLVRVLLPMSSPGIMTGFILAMSRAAGEVAPLMITGVVKLAPEMPLDGQFPFFHPDRKFMHLGFHIFDIGFQSPNVEASKPMVYVTTLLLLLIVLTMTSVAIYLRNSMRKRYQSRSV